MPGYPVVSSGLPEVHTLRSADKAFRGRGEDEGVEVIVEVDRGFGCGMMDRWDVELFWFWLEISKGSYLYNI